MTSDPIYRGVPRLLSAAGALGFAAVTYGYLTLPDVRVLARTNPTTTAFMELRARDAEKSGRTTRTAHRWVPYARISRNLTSAVIAAEDGAFWQHDGLDYREIRTSIETAIERGGEIRGASTITQQLAKNLYLSPSRDPLRKLRELIIARRLEATLSKARILEIYLNVVEWGDGIWGAEAAARAYFGVPAAALSREQAALLAGALINPIVYDPGRPPARLLRRQQIILSRMGGAADEPAHEIASEVSEPDDLPAPVPPAPAEDPALPIPDTPVETPFPDPVPPLEGAPPAE